MSHFSYFLAFSVLIFSQVSHSVKTEYFWREYTGEIPDDAVVAGKDINNKDIYIGQAYLKNAGLLVVQITPGVREVNVPFKGIKKVNKYTKVLCGPQEKFYWMQGNSKTLHLDLIGKQSVIGGHEDDFGYISIGRINHEGELKVGKINSFHVETALFFFSNNGKETNVNSYEILMFNGTAQDKTIDFRAGIGK